MNKMNDLWIAAASLKQTVQSAIEAGDWKVDGACDPTMDLEHLANCLANPGKREWVGLTDEQIDTLPWTKTYEGDVTLVEALRDFARAIEAKLREKNT